MISRELMRLIRQEFMLDWDGIHGIQHWIRVRDNGIRLAELTGADLDVVEFFAFLHDSQRRNEWKDVEHGARAAKFVTRLRRPFITLSDREFEHLVFACRFHSDGLIKADVTVQTCWDADRLDLGRVGKRPNPKFLCTSAAKEESMIEWAYKRSKEGA